MKMTKIIAIAVTFFMCFSTLGLLAQGPPPSGGNGGGAGAPIDGGIITLVIGAAVMGYRKMKENRKEKEKSV